MHAQRAQNYKIYLFDSIIMCVNSDNKSRQNVWRRKSVHVTQSTKLWCTMYSERRGASVGMSGEGVCFGQPE